MEPEFMTEMFVAADARLQALGYTMEERLRILDWGRMLGEGFYEDLLDMTEYEIGVLADEVESMR